jgi:hypothetical protein
MRGKRRKRKKSRRTRKSRKRKPKMSFRKLRLIFTLIAVLILVIVYLIVTFLLPMFQEKEGSTCKGSADCLKDLCPVGSQATADQDDGQLQDSYGRMLAVVYCDGKNLNRELLDNGHAIILTQYCAESEFGGDDWATDHGC